MSTPGSGPRRWPTVLVALLPWLAMPSCGGGGEDGGLYTSIPEESAERTLAQELCRLMLERCDCSTPQQLFDSVAECTDAYAAQLEMQFADAKAAGLVYHAECMAEHVNFFTQTVGCTTQSELTLEISTQLDAPPCKVHSGPGKAGDACTSYYQALGDDCDVGLQCLNTCMAAVEITSKAEGEACNLQTDRCEPGTACLASADDPTGPATCLRLPGEGEPCSVGCDEGFSCDFVDDGTTRVCKAPPREGEPCGSLPYECAEGLWCSSGVCTLTLPEGEPCFGQDEACGAGFACSEPRQDGGEDVCMPEEAFVCF